TSLAFAFGPCWIAVQSLFRRTTTARPRIAAVDDLAVGQAVTLHYPTSRDPCLHLRKEHHLFLAYSILCSHLMCPAPPELDRIHLHCPCHEGYFDATTGDPIAGPPRRPLPKFVLEIDEGNNYATGVEARPS